MARHCINRSPDDVPQTTKDPRLEQPWNSWPAAIRYVMVEASRVMPTAALIWLAYIHR